MNAFVVTVERIAGSMLALVAFLTFGEALLRYVLGVQIPDAYSFAGMLQAVAIFWGIASTTYEGRHIAVDMLWHLSDALSRRAIDLFAELVSFLFFATLSYMLVMKIRSSYVSQETTNDLLLPLWPYVTLAFLGIACAAILSLLRFLRAMKRPR
jgi:TRAP-type C4-dicarboxylate transport system permease small subunit